ncbi:ATP-dependent RNA helicase HrpA [Chitinimonas taiwanensis]|uniref:ATP-dependent helicase HrpA n=1 Tax=Chitinimonas taiwanensis DSM 18899 TaxID=1121279 RepID=A0A1K2HAW0_9NEIS|nr:ATP-dependent RNA helicase HrpA [Chitinimonas taiwanensis]SFZ73948.1 ATP-dependent helicase HrpA [Chitinimonas taiwanensis DSM 18899]
MLPAQFDQALQTCLLRDQHGLRQKARTLRERIKQKQPADKLAQELEQAIGVSQAKYQARLGKLPKPQFDEALPVNQRRDELLKAISEHQVVIVCGETGSGKTTQLPKLCLQLGRGVAGLIGHTQPRRLAARTVATRIAQELKTEIGDTVGYKVRFTDKSSELSLVKLMTDGILLAETQTDRFLSQYDTIIVDEAHERSLNIDFLLGFLKQLLPKRPDLKVIVTSATIDAERFSQHFNGAPVIEVSGRTYPVEVRYKELRSNDADDADLEMEEAVVDAVQEVWRHDGLGDVLVFLPGEREIRETAEQLRRAKIMGAEIVPLFARLSVEDQQKVFKPSNGRRIVLSTNVAETSLTVPGIKYVIDSGLARVNRYSPRAKVEQLQIEKISQASARQRAGRCGRVAAGVCIRLYSEKDFNTRPAFTDPEIIRSSLAAVILRMQALRLGKVEDFPFLEAPSGRLIADGYALLHELGAVDEQGTLTRLGTEMARLPIDPKIGRMLLAGRDEGCLSEMLIIASALSIQDPRERPFEARDAADRAQAKFADEKSDFVSLLNLWAFFEAALKNKQSNRLLVQECHAHFLSYLRMREWRELHKQLADIVEDMGWKPSAAPKTEAPAARNDVPHLPKKAEKERQQAAQHAYDALHRALCAGLLGQVGFKQPEDDEYLGARGIKFSIFPGSALKKARPKWVVSAELVETTKLYARCVAAIQPEWLEKLAGHLVQRDYFEPHWDEGMGQVVASERVTLYGLPVIAKRRIHYGAVRPEHAREIMLREGLAGRRFNTRAAFWLHNEKLISEIEELEHKARRQDVLVDEEVLFAFYEQKVPADIINAQGFEAWRKQAEKDTPQLLFLSRDDLMRHAGESITEQQFPPELVLDGLPLPLAYRFEPGHALDGVTVQLPLHLLNKVNGAAFDWLVPGLIREKITLLVKSLPKSIRRQCVPVPEFVTRMMTELDRADRRAPLLPQLAHAVGRGIGAPVSVDEFDASELPKHLQMNIRVVDDAGQELASERDLVLLRSKLGEAAQMTFREVAAAPVSSSKPGQPPAKGQQAKAQAAVPAQPKASGPAIEKDGISSWDFGDLPAKLNFERHGAMLSGYPALVPHEGACAIRLFDVESMAAAEHRRGVVRLMQLELKEQVKQLPKCFANFTQTALLLRGLADSDSLMDDLVAAVCDRAFVGDDELPRSKKDFDNQKQRAKTRLPAVRDAAYRALQEVTAEYQQLQGILAKPVRLQSELKQQLGRLVYKGFLSATPWEQLPHLPRYLKAMKGRLAKYNDNQARDAQRGADVAALWARWEAEQDKWRKQGRDPAPLLPFRWMLEELRVSLFAQELRTPYPVSVKRLEKIWAELIRQ